MEKTKNVDLRQAFKLFLTTLWIPLLAVFCFWYAGITENRAFYIIAAFTLISWIRKLVKVYFLTDEDSENKK